MDFKTVNSKAERIDGWLFGDEPRILYSYAHRVRGNIVEIGSFKGKSTNYLLASGNIVYAVDTFLSTNTNAYNEGKDTYEQFINNTKDFSNLIVIKSDSVLAGKEFNKPISLLFVDGGHNYEQVRDDIIAWKDKVVSGGYLIFHDHYPNGRYDAYPGVRKAVSEILGEQYIIVDSQNTMVVVKKK